MKVNVADTQSKFESNLNIFPTKRLRHTAQKGVSLTKGSSTMLHNLVTVILAANGC